MQHLKQQNTTNIGVDFIIHNWSGDVATAEKLEAKKTQVSDEKYFVGRYLTGDNINEKGLLTTFARSMMGRAFHKEPVNLTRVHSCLKLLRKERQTHILQFTLPTSRYGRNRLVSLFVCVVSLFVWLFLCLCL